MRAAIAPAVRAIQMPPGNSLHEFGHEGAKVQGTGHVSQPGEPVESAAVEPQGVGGRGREAHCQREDFGAEQGPADALDSCIAAAQSRSPPEGARGVEPGLGGRRDCSRE